MGAIPRAQNTTSFDVGQLAAEKTAKQATRCLFLFDRRERLKGFRFFRCVSFDLFNRRGRGRLWRGHHSDGHRAAHM